MNCKAMHTQAKTLFRNFRPVDASKQAHTPQDADKAILLKQFGNQVSGRAGIFCYNSTTLCKPFVSRELYFYDQLPSELKNFTPEFKGVINVTFVENGDDGSMIAFAHSKTLIKKNSQAIRSLIEIPRPHSKRCVQDYGRTHVIYPTNPLISSIRAKPKSGSEFSACDESEVEKLAQGFGTNVCIRATDDAESGGVGDFHAEQLRNPWNSKVISDVWTKMKNGQNEEDMSKKTKRFMLLENVTSSYRRPCILDLKIGTRVREDASPAKLARHVTAIDVGARLSGMQIYNPERKEFVYVNKYYGHNLSVAGLKSNLVDFFSRGRSSFVRNAEVSNTLDASSHVYEKSEENSDSLLTERSLRNMDADLVSGAVNQLVALRDAIAAVTSYRFYSGSVLLIYEGEPDHSAERPATSPKSKHCSAATDAARTQAEASGHHWAPPGKFPKWRRTSGNGQNTCLSKSSDHDCGPSCESALVNRGESCDHVTSSSPYPENLCTASRQQAVERSEQDCDVTERRPRSSRRGSGTKSAAAPGRNAPHQQDLLFDAPLKHSVHCQIRSARPIDVRLIDFAHYCLNDPMVHPGPDGAFLFGIDSVITLLRSMIST